MKHYFILFTGILLVASCGGGNLSPKQDSTKPEGDKQLSEAESKEKDARVFGIASGIIVTAYDSSSSVDTLYFDKWGTRSAKYEYQDIPGKSKPQLAQIEIEIGETSYTIDPASRTGMKMTNPMGQFTGGDAFDYQRARMLQMLGEVKTGTGTILGKTCDIWEDQSAPPKEEWLYKGIEMKAVVRMESGDVVSHVIHYEENVTIPEAKFKIPVGIKFN